MLPYSSVTWLLGLSRRVQRMIDNTGVMPLASGDAEIADAGPVGISGREAALGRAHQQPVSRPHGAIGVGAEAATRLQLDANLQRLARNAANGIGAPHGLGLDNPLASEVLARLEAIVRRQFGGDIKGYSHGVRRLRLDPDDFKIVGAHVECGSST